MSPGFPVIEELKPPPDVESAFAAFSRLPHCLCLDSALRHRQVGRFSFLTADPFDYVEAAADGNDAFGMLERRLAGLTADNGVPCASKSFAICTSQATK